MSTSTLVAQPCNGVGPSRPLRVAHLLASRGLAGKERQLLSLVSRDSERCRSRVLLFCEGDQSRALLAELQSRGVHGSQLAHDTPWLPQAAREVAAVLRHESIDLLCTHDYKSNLVGLAGTRRTEMPVVGVFHGHTAQDWKVRGYEALDRHVLRRLSHVVCVANASAERLSRAGLEGWRSSVIHNAVENHAARDSRDSCRRRLERLWAKPPSHIVGAAGRLSHEKGFDVLIAAAAHMTQRSVDAGFVIFGEGPHRARLQTRIDGAGLAGRFVLAGFRDDLPRWLPGFDVLAMPSRTEGLPTIALEAMQAGVPVVASRVGGLPEVIDNGRSGLLVPPEQPESLANALSAVLDDGALAGRLRDSGRSTVAERFDADRQAREYHTLFARLTRAGSLSA